MSNASIWHTNSKTNQLIAAILTIGALTSDELTRAIPPDNACHHIIKWGSQKLLKNINFVASPSKCSGLHRNLTSKNNSSQISSTPTVQHILCTSHHPDVCGFAKGLRIAMNILETPAF
jgi:hypothetical protein